MASIAQTCTSPRFRLGRIVATPDALAALERASEHAATYLSRHVLGDWGNVCPEDSALNDAAVAHEGDDERQSRVLSAYTTGRGERLWIITEADRSSTCLLAPADY